MGTPISTRILAIDPGSEQSAWVVLDGTKVLEHGKVLNTELLDRITGKLDPGAFSTCASIAIEMFAGYGKAVGREVFDTCVWIGRFTQAWLPRPTKQVLRRQVKDEVCDNVHAHDRHVRDALLDKYGGKVVALGKKTAPGPLFGFKADEWSALAIGITAQALERRATP